MLQITSTGIEENFKKARGLHQAGDFALADKLYVQVLTGNPRHAEGWRWRGIMAAQAGQAQAGIEMLRQAVALRSPYPEAWNDLGSIYMAVHKYADAAAAYEEALRQAPQFVECWNNLGIAFGRLEKKGEALAAFEKAIAIRPDYWDAYNGVGMSLLEQGRIDDALAFLVRAVERKGDHPEMLNNLGNTYKACGRYEEAIGVYQRAIAARPKFAEARNNMGNAFKDLGKLEEAIAVYREAITIAPGWSEIHNNLANALKDAGRVEEALGAYRQALTLRPTLTAAHSNLVYVRQFCHAVDPAEDLCEARRWNEVQAGPLKAGWRGHENERDAGRRLRVGYVSPDFRTHSVAYFMENLLACHDPAQIETFCYSDATRPDAVTERLRRKAGQWRPTLAIPDAKLAEMVRADRIDILVDLSGHTAAHRLLMFARKPAPVQVSYLGYSGTTGLAAMDYRLTDGIADPEELGEERFYSEELVRLPGTFLCFRPDEGSPAVGEGPVVRNGFVTFGSFNALPKLTQEMAAVWARILLACPGSRLVLKTRGLGDGGVRGRLEKIFADLGVERERLELMEKVASPEEHLGCYARVDIALDTFPYHGTTTTCEALWMGVPVVSLAGHVHRSRVGTSILTNVGLTELIARDMAEYERIAVGLAGNPQRLIELRGGLRERMRGSALMDGARLARSVEAAYRQMWRRWCESGHG